MAEITGSPPSDPARHRTLAPFGGITRIRFKGSSDFRTSQPLRLPRINYVQNRTTRGEVNAGRIVAGVCLKRRILERRLAEAPLQRAAPLPAAFVFLILFAAEMLRASRSFPYFVAASSFILVWKMACHPPFAIFQTDPALKVPEASFPS